ncbi:MAG: hypothetical protein GY854_02280 [Deltaproteobacteria bacterium]|nr:hypothetical protein [Deltaproteobacteria bacterium]
MANKFRYFSSVQGQVVQRYGTDTFIGVKRTANGWDWNDESVVPIPETECSRYEREYQNAVRNGALKIRTQKDYEAYLNQLKKEDSTSADDTQKTHTSRRKQDKKGDDA